MEVMLVLVFWVVTGPYVPMPDWPTCEEAIVEAETELNPYTAYCTEVRRPKAVTPRNPTTAAPGAPLTVNASSRPDDGGAAGRTGCDGSSSGPLLDDFDHSQHEARVL
jgi:hypothetical protein